MYMQKRSFVFELHSDVEVANFTTSAKYKY